MNFKIELDREDDGRWIAEVPELPGVMTYGKSRDDAIAHVQALALRVLADRLARGKRPGLIACASATRRPAGRPSPAG